MQARPPITRLSKHRFFKFTEQVRTTTPEQQQAFFAFDLGLTEEDKQCLDDFTISRSEDYVNAGNLEKLLSELEAFITSLGKNAILRCTRVTMIILEQVEQIIESFNQETALVMVRASQPNDDFKIPRWHMDGYYYSPYSGEQYKAALTLKGPGTLFYNVSATQRKQFESIRNDRLQTSQMLDPSKAVSIPTGEGAVFVVGSPDTAAVHSEPHINSQRLFVSILPGSKKQMAEYAEMQRSLQDNPDIKRQMEAAMRVGM